MAELFRDRAAGRLGARSVPQPRRLNCIHPPQGCSLLPLQDPKCSFPVLGGSLKGDSGTAPDMSLHGATRHCSGHQKQTED